MCGFAIFTCNRNKHDVEEGTDKQANNFQPHACHSAEKYEIL